VLDLGYQVELTEKAKNYVVEKGWDVQFGARPLKRAIQKYIEDPLAEEIIKSKIHSGDTILVDYLEESDEIKVMVQKAELAKK
jgi:ATP-dependent Clp protease ATP-binding subunit ClpC